MTTNCRNWSPFGLEPQQSQGITLSEGLRNFGLSSIPRFSKWEQPAFGDKMFGTMRPGEQELIAGQEELKKYFDAMMSIPSHKRFVEGTHARGLRGRDGEDNILFRPVAQVALSQAVAQLRHDRNVALRDIIGQLTQQEVQGQLQLRRRDAPWFGVLCG